MSIFSENSDLYREKDTQLLLWKHTEKQNSNNKGSDKVAMMDREQSQHRIELTKHKVDITVLPSDKLLSGVGNCAR